MRRTNILWLGLAVFCGAVLFHTSQQVTDGREKLAVINHDIRKEEETLRVLQAEWSYLNQPDRLEKLVRQYLPLEAMKGRQFTKMEDLEKTPLATATAIKEVPTEDASAPPPETAAAETVKPVAPSPALSSTLPKSAVIQKQQAMKPPATRQVQTAAPKTPPKANPATKQVDGRNFSDLMKSLGVH